MYLTLGTVPTSEVTGEAKVIDPFYEYCLRDAQDSLTLAVAMMTNRELQASLEPIDIKATEIKPQNS